MSSSPALTPLAGQSSRLGAKRPKKEFSGEMWVCRGQCRFTRSPWQACTWWSRRDSERSAENLVFFPDQAQFYCCSFCISTFKFPSIQMEAKGQKPVKEVVNTTKISRLCVRRVASITAAEPAPYPPKEPSTDKSAQIGHILHRRAQKCYYDIGSNRKGCKRR